MLRALCMSVSVLAMLFVAAPHCAADLLGVYGENDNKFLGRINRHTGQVQEIGPIGTNVQSLAWDGSHLYAVEHVDFTLLRLLRIDHETGSRSIVGTMNVSNVLVTGLAYDSARDTLWAAGFGGLFQINRQNAHTTLISNEQHFNSSDLAYDPLSDRLLIANGPTIGSYDPETELFEMTGTLPIIPYGLTFNAASNDIIAVGVREGSDVVGSFHAGEFSKSSEVIDLNAQYFSGVALVPAPSALILFATFAFRVRGRRR